MLKLNFDSGDDWRESYSEEVNGHRAVVILDEYPSEPDHECGCPVLRIEPSGYGSGSVTFTGYGSGSYKGDGISHTADDALQKFVTEYGWSEGVEVFERYIRIFHGGTTTTYSGHGYRDAIYVAYTTEAMVRDVWGNTDLTGIEAEMSEWVSYVEGDVYGIRVETRRSIRTRITDVTGEEEELVIDSTRDEWVTVADTEVWGHYGTEYAEEAALEMLEWAMKDAAA